MILSATQNLKYRAILVTIYSAGLRVSEVARLKVADIDGQRMTIRVRGKGDKDRYTLLGKNALETASHLLEGISANRLAFSSKNPKEPISVSWIQKVFKTSLGQTGIRKRATVHTLRHCFATHLLESGCGSYTISSVSGPQQRQNDLGLSSRHPQRSSQDRKPHRSHGAARQSHNLRGEPLPCGLL